MSRKTKLMRSNVHLMVGKFWLKVGKIGRNIYEHSLDKAELHTITAARYAVDVALLDKFEIELLHGKKES